MNFIQRNNITIAACSLLILFFFGWWILAQSATISIGEDIVVGGNLSVGGNQVITSAGVLQNVTADAGIITSGTFPAGISANAPTQNAHLATKLYVDNAIAAAGRDHVLQCGITATHYLGNLGGVSGANAICASNFGAGWTFAQYNKWLGMAPNISLKTGWVQGHANTCDVWTSSGSIFGTVVQVDGRGWVVGEGSTCTAARGVACCNF